ncbi:MAG: carboxypeptidase regulatory-like domain-containing protein, partial [Firmicutes bacterium]|nr:carboxypeptidase regulatory-like domain-containing protein [Bacillota bacterium]
MFTRLRTDAAIFLIIAISLLLSLASCRGPNADKAPRTPLDEAGSGLTSSSTTEPAPGPASGSSSGSASDPASGSSSGFVPSPVSLQTREVTFRVKVPQGTPPGEQVYVLVWPLLDWTWTQHVPLKPEGGGVWSGAVAMEEGALAHYVYDRWDEKEWGEAFKAKRETAGERVPVESRLLLVTSELQMVEDVIAGWNDLPGTAPTGTVTGTVVDAETGKPLMDANVSVGGIHTATDFDGRFRWDGVAAGGQRITVHRNLGDYKPAAATVEVPPGDAAETVISMQATRPVRVTFEVALPEDTPPEAEIRLLGGAFQAGARPGPHPNQPIMAEALDFPVLRRSAPGRAKGSLDLYEGTYLQYYYSIGSFSHGREFDTSGQEVYRSFLPGLSSTVRRDSVAAWRAPGQSRVKLRLTVPPNTAPNAYVSLVDGPTHWMTRTGPLEWTFFLHGSPGQEFRYRYVLAEDIAREEGSAGLQEVWHTLVIPPSDTVREERIRSWSGYPAVEIPEAGRPAQVTFRVTIPTSAPPGAVVRLLGDDPVLAGGISMTPQPGNPWLYEVTTGLARAGEISYRYELGLPGAVTGPAASAASGSAASAASSPNPAPGPAPASAPGPAPGPVSVPFASRQAEITYSGQVLDDWVTDWKRSPSGSQGTRPGFIAGVYTPDFWSQGFLALSPGTFERIKTHNGNLVVVSSVWSYGQTQPLPAVESRQIRAGSVYTPREDLLAQARLAKEKGLKVMLGPQFNMEMSPGGVQAVCRDQNAAWWRAWLGEAERLWLWNARVAAEMEAEVLMLPGPCFHVFGEAVSFGSPEFASEFDDRVTALISRVRQEYRGKLLVTGSARGFNFPKRADLVGVTTFDTGHPDLPFDATVADWRTAYDRLFAERVDPLHSYWNKPVFFYTVHLPSIPGDPDPTGQTVQARRLEGFFQALESRSWIDGTLSWAYSMIDVPLLPGEGVRARPAEAVLAKYYG